MGWTTIQNGELLSLAAALSRHGRESLEKIINRFAGFKVVKQGLHRNPCSVEHCSAAHYIGIA
jgi:hypothetical protein